MTQQGVRPIQSHIRHSSIYPDIETATRWFDATRQLAFNLTRCLHRSSNARQPRHGDALVRCHAARGVQPDRITYSTLIARSPDITTATGWFEAMGHASIQPDTVTFNTLIKLSPDIASAAQCSMHGVCRRGSQRRDLRHLINLSPDIATATQWYEIMREAKVQATR
jgi:hypothetical protein